MLAPLLDLPDGHFYNAGGRSPGPYCRSGAGGADRRLHRFAVGVCVQGKAAMTTTRFCTSGTALRASVAVLIAALVVLLGCPAIEPPAPQAGVTDVVMRNLAFVPGRVTIHCGESVRWTNQDSVPHTTTSGSPADADAGSLWDSGLIFPGQSAERQFNTVGEFVYFCRVHPTRMFGVQVVVVP